MIKMVGPSRKFSDSRWPFFFHGPSNRWRAREGCTPLLMQFVAWKKKKWIISRCTPAVGFIAIVHQILVAFPWDKSLRYLVKTSCNWTVNQQSRFVCHLNVFRVGVRLHFTRVINRWASHRKSARSYVEFHSYTWDWTRYFSSVTRVILSRVWSTSAANAERVRKKIQLQNRLALPYWFDLQGPHHP